MLPRLWPPSHTTALQFISFRVSIRNYRWNLAHSPLQDIKLASKLPAETARNNRCSDRRIRAVLIGKLMNKAGVKDDLLEQSVALRSAPRDPRQWGDGTDRRRTTGGTTGRCVRPGTPETREPSLWLAGLFVGIVLGAVRGSFLTFQFDRMYSRLRLPAGRDGLWAACLLAFCTLVAVGAPLANSPALEVGAAGLVAACAGYLAGRAAALWRRSLSAPHQSLHQIPP